MRHTKSPAGQGELLNWDQTCKTNTRVATCRAAFERTQQDRNFVLVGATKNGTKSASPNLPLTAWPLSNGP
jgi:hypothetical protein